MNLHIREIENKIQICHRDINTLKLLNNVNDLEASNTVSACLHNLKPTTVFFDKFVRSKKTLLTISGLIYLDMMPLDLIISKIEDSNINIRDYKSAKLTASYIIANDCISIYSKSQKINNTVDSFSSDKRERFVIEEILRLIQTYKPQMQITKPLAFDVPCAFYAQTPKYRKGNFGNEYCGEYQMTSGYNYGDAEKFAIIGIAPDRFICQSYFYKPEF